MERETEFFSKFRLINKHNYLYFFENLIRTETYLLVKKKHDDFKRLQQVCNIQTNFCPKILILTKIFLFKLHETVKKEQLDTIELLEVEYATLGRYHINK